MSPDDSHKQQNAGRSLNMKFNRQLVILSTLAMCLATRADNTEEKIARNFYLPEQVRKYADALNLTEDQKTTLKNAYESAQQKVEQLKAQQQAEAQKFNELAKAAQVDEKALFAQGDKYLDADREIKHAQLALLITIKNNLTAEQKATLDGMKALAPKLQEAQKLGDKWKSEGRDMTKLEGMKAEFDAALQAGKIKEADALVDRALDILNERAGK
jgi:Spy/CpxP family protein refolding chaperone